MTIVYFDNPIEQTEIQNELSRLFSGLTFFFVNWDTDFEEIGLDIKNPHHIYYDLRWDEDKLEFRFTLSIWFNESYEFQELSCFLGKHFSDFFNCRTIIGFNLPSNPQDPYYSLVFENQKCFLVDDSNTNFGDNTDKLIECIHEYPIIISDFDEFAYINGSEKLKNPINRQLESNSTQRQIQVKLYKKPIKGLKLFLVSLFFVSLGCWLLISDSVKSKDIFIAWLTISFFGLGLLVGIYQTFDRRPQIILNEKGIWDRTTRQQWIKWEQILQVSHFTLYKQRFVKLKLDPSFVKTHYYLNKKKSASQFVDLLLSQLSIDEKQMAKFIREMIKKDVSKRFEIIDKHFKDIDYCVIQERGF
ncbi:MAG: STM3941 family protein [Fluviicola sp.]